MVRSSKLLHALLGAFVLSILTGCGQDATPANPNVGPKPIDIETPDGGRCEVLDPVECMTPFPSDALTIADASTRTGLRVNYALESMPANASGTHVDPSEWNRNDGFSPAAQITVLLPGVDPVASGLAPVTDLARSLEPDSSLIVLNAETGERQLVWAEVDSHADDPARRALLIQPARHLREGQRHIVAMRNLVDQDGVPMEPSEVFRAFRDATPTTNEIIEARRPAMERIFSELADHGVDRESLNLAWEFTTASQESLSERLLFMRDESFESLGEAAPEFVVESVDSSGAARTIRGTFIVPLYLTGDGGPGAFLNNGFGGPLPRVNGVYEANFVCVVPTTSNAENPARGFLYGHGLLGSASEAAGIGQLGVAVNAAFCATDWIGMSTNDVPNAAAILGDLSLVRGFPDRLQQAHLNFLFLGRLMIHPDGFNSDPAFRNDDSPALATEEVFFLGASQGGILGGATMAVSLDSRRAVMAVGGSTYSVLIPRSIDFDGFSGFYEEAYPDPFDRRLGLGLAQMLWDRGEASGYLQHLTRDPYPNTPPKDVLYLMAFADHQVANVATEVAARTVGAFNREPALAPGRSSAVEPFFDMPAVPEFPFSGSALVTWDFGTPPPPDENLPPREGEDPHGKAADVAAILIMVSEYLRTDGGLLDVCGGEPCQTLP